MHRARLKSFSSLKRKKKKTIVTYTSDGNDGWLLDNIPLPDGAQPARLRERKKPTVYPPAVSPGTSNTNISTDGQLTTFNMADVPLPSTKYNTDTQTLSIPLPEGNNSSTTTSSSSSSSSKTLVDKLFEDFLSQKIKQPERSTKAQSSSKPAFTNSVEEIKRFLDKEINQLSSKAGFAESPAIGADTPDVKNQIAAEREAVHEESTSAENASTVVNQRTTMTLPLKIKISDSSVARISSAQLRPPSCNLPQSDELVDKVPVDEEECQPTAKTVCSVSLPENKTTEVKIDPITPEADPESNGAIADVEAKPSKSSKKHKHKKKKSHKHSKDKNKSNTKLRLHTNLTSHIPVTTSVALVTPVTTSSTLQVATVSSVSNMAPPLLSQSHSTSSSELPAVSHCLESVTPSSSVPLSNVTTANCSQSDLLLQTSSPVVSEALLFPALVSTQSPPLSLSSQLNQLPVLSSTKILQPVHELGGTVSHVAASLETLPSLDIFNKSQEKGTVPNCSQTSLQMGLLEPSTSMSSDLAPNSCMSSPTDLNEQANKVDSLKPLTKNPTAKQSGLLGLAAYFKSKAKSPSPESTKDIKPAKSSSKKTKCFSDSSDESLTQKRSRSTSRKSSHSRSLSRSGIGKHSSSDKRKKTRPRSRRSRSWSRSRSHSRSWSKSRRRSSLKSTKKRSRSRSRSRSDERGRQSSFRSSKRCFSRSPSRSRNKTYGRSRSRSRSHGRNWVTGRGASKSRSPSKRASYRRTRSRSRSYSRGRYRHRVSSRSNKSKSRSRSRSRSNIRSRDKRSRSRSSGHHRDYRQSNNKFRRFSRRRSSPRSRSSSASSSHSRRRRSRSKSANSLGIDKVKLHDIAVKKLLESGQAPKEEVASLRAGGKTVQGLIDYCKRISQKELESDSGDSTQAALKSDDDDDEESPFIHHPFRLRETQPNIVLNIKNAKPLPVLTPQEKLIQSSTLRLQFPVSSGSQHRAKESQWVPVQKNSASTTLFAAEESVSSSTGSSIQSTAAAAAAFTSDGGLPSEASGPVSKTITAGTNLAAPVLNSQTIENKSNGDNVFPDTLQQTVDISQVMTERMLAVQKLQENPNDVQALNVMYKAQQEVNRWAQSKQLPGQFTGSTGAKVMTQEELNGPDKRFQAWAKKEQLQNAAPVRGGIGMHLLQKMGWRQGEGLGKHNEGPTEPILVNVKVDRKGLTSHGEDPKKSLAVEVAGKHPVSALVELCSKCKWGTPLFQQVEEKGPDHKKSFMFKVTVNNITYQPTMPSNSKKNGRARAAILCLQDLGQMCNHLSALFFLPPTFPPAFIQSLFFFPPANSLSIILLSVFLPLFWL
ncbi:SON [Acanthosepion pharaonis]|uniref:SON n=1 Tax=Acanthosepion pharaonis TaxID=158019 RepID=A0A812CA53_ACAPH|nr:SON [Sepia pharaonis]